MEARPHANGGQAAACLGRILVVDDEPELCRFIHDYLSWLGYEVHTAKNVPTATEMLRQKMFDLVITDLRMEGPSGLELLLEVKARAPETRAILMSAHADAHAASVAIDYGVDHLLPKPFEAADLQKRVEESFARRNAQQQIEQEWTRLRIQLHQEEVRGQKWIHRAAHALASAVEAKDQYTAGHANRVTAYAVILAEEVGDIDLERFRLACDLHDVGKIGIPDAVLNRPSRLSEEEYVMIADHPNTGARILMPLIDDPLVIGAVRWHHERWDGQGYPDRIMGEAIPMVARILAVADALDAMTSLRAYRRAQSWEHAVEEIRRCSGSQFDPAVVAAFERALPRLEQCYLDFSE